MNGARKGVVIAGDGNFLGEKKNPIIEQSKK
jgi:hypothetical protein